MLCFQIGVTKEKETNLVGFSYHPRAIANEWTAVALQFRCSESLVNIFDGVSTDHCSAPEQKAERRVITFTIQAGQVVIRDMQEHSWTFSADPGI